MQVFNFEEINPKQRGFTRSFINLVLSHYEKRMCFAMRFNDLIRYIDQFYSFNSHLGTFLADELAHPLYQDYCYQASFALL